MDDKRDVDENRNIEITKKDKEDILPPVQAVLKTSIWQDVCDSVYDSRYVSVIFLLLALYVGYSITLAPYQSSKQTLTKEQRSLETLVSYLFPKVCLVFGSENINFIVLPSFLPSLLPSLSGFRNIFDRC